MASSRVKGLIGAALVVAACSVPEHGHAATRRPPTKLAPPVICNMEHRLDIFEDEDGILWACECEVLFKGFICRWQVIGGVDKRGELRRRWLRLHPRAMVVRA